MVKAVKKLLKTVNNNQWRSKMVSMVKNWQKWSKMINNGQKQSETANNGQTTVKNDQ